VTEHKVIRITESEEDLIPLCEVAFAPPFPNPAPPDPPGELAWLDVGDLYIDKRYQRPVGPRGEKNIRQVIENFSWSLFSPLVVARRSKGRYAVIDGQHRSLAALTHGGIKQCPCYIINGDPADEAKAFSVINGAVTAILPGQIWHARVIAGDQDSLTLHRLLEELGITVLRSNKQATQMKVGETAAVDALEWCFKTYGKPVLKLALQTVIETGKGNPGWIRAPIIKATCAFINRNLDLLNKHDMVISKIKSVGIRYMYEKAELTKAKEHITLMKAYERELEQLFNRKE
jgi:hypothetical protein